MKLIEAGTPETPLSGNDQVCIWLVCVRFATRPLVRVKPIEIVGLDGQLAEIVGVKPCFFTAELPLRKKLVAPKAVVGSKSAASTTVKPRSRRM